MILEIECKDHRISVNVATLAGVRRVTLDGEEVPCDWVRLADGHYSLIVRERVFDFIIELSEGTCTITGGNGPLTMKIFDVRRPARNREIDVGQSGLQRLKADMPGKVVRLLVKEGESVAFEQGLLVLEAMKMQNEIRAPKSGIVREIGVTSGTAVNMGQFLISLE